MKIAIPSATDEGLASMRSGHFGHTPFFTIVEYDDSGTITSVESVQTMTRRAAAESSSTCLRWASMAS